MNELLVAIALEGGFHSFKRKKESRRKFLLRNMEREGKYRQVRNMERKAFIDRAEARGRTGEVGGDRQL